MIKKNFLLLVVLGISMSAMAQISNDSLLARIKNDERIIADISNNLALCHREFRTGTIVLFAGLAGTLGTTILIKSDSHATARNIGYIGSSFLIFSGSIIMIDSHKFIGDAGSISVSPEGLKILYGF